MPTFSLPKTLTVLLACSLSSQAWAFAREFNQNNSASVFQAESSAELCLFVSSRQGILMIQPHCMVSSSSHATGNPPYLNNSDKLSTATQ